MAYDFRSWEETLEALRAVRARRDALAAAELELVAQARRDRITWREIGAALGVTTQTAHARFRAVDPRSRRRLRDPIQAELDALYASAPAAEKSGPSEGSDP